MRRVPRRTALLLSVGMPVLAGCHRAEGRPTLFELLPAERTGVTFVNRLPEDAAFNILNYLYYYNGGGVAVGDVNNDGLPDLYFTSNRGPNRLYLNKGNYRFEDVTERAGVADSEGWKTGVTMADVDGDGWVDIYVSAVNYLTMHGHNVLYINNGDGTFTDRTKEYGLDHVGASTQALFFDYDGDGDLDMYLLNHSTHTDRAISRRATGADRTSRSSTCCPTSRRSSSPPPMPRASTSFTSGCRPAITPSTLATRSSSTAARWGAPYASARSATWPACTQPTGAGPRCSPTWTTTGTRTSSSPTASIAGPTTWTTSTTWATRPSKRRWRRG